MSASGVASPTRALPGQAETVRLAVAWQDPNTRKIHAVGLLDYNGTTYTFRYVRHAASIADFRLLGFPSLHRRYEASDLFPLFDQRVMDPRRPDYPQYLLSLGLPETVTPVELLARSGGRRVGDAIMLFPEPQIDADGSTACSFLVHGIRHKSGENEQRLLRLRTGQALLLEDEPTNPVNPRAVLITSDDGVRLGWVPDLLLDYVHAVRDFGDVSVTAVHINGPAVPPHHRLLVELRGCVARDYRPFSQGEWTPLA